MEDFFGIDVQIGSRQCSQRQRLRLVDNVGIQKGAGHDDCTGKDPSLAVADRSASGQQRALSDLLATCQIVESAIQEDVDVIAMSILSGAHDYLFPKVMELLREKGIDDVLVLGGGIIPDEDIPALKDSGIAEVFGPGTTTGEIITYIKENILR